MAAAAAGQRPVMVNGGFSLSFDAREVTDGLGMHAGYAWGVGATGYAGLRARWVRSSPETFGLGVTVFGTGDGRALLPEWLYGAAEAVALWRRVGDTARLGAAFALEGGIVTRPALCCRAAIGVNVLSPLSIPTGEITTLVVSLWWDVRQ